MVLEWKISLLSFNFGLQFYDISYLLMSHYFNLVIILPYKFLCWLYRKSILI